MQKEILKETILSDEERATLHSVILEKTSNVIQPFTKLNIDIPQDESKIISPTNTSTSNQKSEGCYIATMAYGSYNHPQVMVLRWYRDNVLQRDFWGRLFIRIYYYISPKLVAVLKGHDAINKAIRNILNKQVQRIIERKIDKERHCVFWHYGKGRG